MREVLQAIYRKVSKSTELQAYIDLRDFSKETMKTDIPLGVE